MDDLDSKREEPSDDWIAFIPSKEYRAIESILDKLNEAQKEFLRIVQGAMTEKG